MGSLALKFEQLIYPRLGTKITTAKPLDTVEGSHPSSMSLRWGVGRVIFFVCLFVRLFCLTVWLQNSGAIL